METQAFNSATQPPTMGFWTELICFCPLLGYMAITTIRLALWSSDKSRQTVAQTMGYAVNTHGDREPRGLQFGNGMETRAQL